MNGAGISGPPRSSGCHSPSLRKFRGFIPLSLALRLSIEAVEVRRGRPQSLLSLSSSPWSPNCCVTTGQTFRSLSLGYLRPFTLTLHGKRRRRRQVATLQNTHATLRNTDVAPISPLSLSHVRRDHRHRRRRVGLTRPTLNPRLNTKRPLARPDFGAGQRGCFSRCRWWELGTGKGRAAGAHPISRPAPLAVSQHKM